jgi:hypothetical protein
MQRRTTNPATMEKIAAADNYKHLISQIHDAIQANGYAEVTTQEAAQFAEPACPEQYRPYAFIKKMFEKGYSISYNEVDGAYTIINEPEVGK